MYRKCLIIPRNIIYQKELGKYRTLFYTYLLSHRCLFDDIVPFTINNIISWSKLSSNRHSGGINEQCINLFNYFSENNYFISYPDFRLIQFSNTKYYEVSLNPDVVDTSADFALISIEELKKIIDCKNILKNNSNVTSSNLLTLLLYIRVNIKSFQKGVVIDIFPLLKMTLVYLLEFFLNISLH